MSRNNGIPRKEKRKETLCGGAPCPRQASDEALNLLNCSADAESVCLFCSVLTRGDKTMKSPTWVFVAPVLRSSNHIRPLLRRDDISWDGEEHGSNL